MTMMMHPRFKARVDDAERLRAAAADRDLLADLETVERQASGLGGPIGRALAQAVKDCCMRFRIALATHPAATPAGRTMRRQIPARIAELKADCAATVAATQGR